MDSIVTVLIATYNGDHYLTEQLDSLLAQDYKGFKVLIRDDGSSDHTLHIIKDYEKKYPDTFTVLDDGLGNLGSSTCFMKLLEHAKGYEYIMFCDQDDVWLPNKISTSLSAMREMEKEFGKHIPLMNFTDLRVVDEHLDEIHASFWKSQRLNPSIANDWKKLLAQNVVTGCTMILNRKAREVSLPFELPEMVHDQWIAVNVAKYGHVGYTPEQTILYRQHANNVVGAHSNMIKYFLKKTLSLSEVLSFFFRAANHFKEVSWFHLVFLKIKISMERLR